MEWEHKLAVAPAPPYGAAAWSEDGLIAVACEHCAIILVRPAAGAPRLCDT
jgi:hypothetical protein